MTHQLPNSVDIKNGPSQWDLMLGLFEPELMTVGMGRELTFELESEDGRKITQIVYIDSIKRALAPNWEVGSQGNAAVCYVTVWVITGDFSSNSDNGFFDKSYNEKEFIAEFETTKRRGLFRF